MVFYQGTRHGCSKTGTFTGLDYVKVKLQRLVGLLLFFFKETMNVMKYYNNLSFIAQLILL
jgi:hypothetical protein